MSFDALIPTFFEPLEMILGNAGLNSPLRRFLFASLLGTSIEFYLKPSYAFKPSGEMIPPVFLDNSPGSTYTPIGLFPVLTGLLLALYI